MNNGGEFLLSILLFPSDCLGYSTLFEKQLEDFVQDICAMKSAMFLSCSRKSVQGPTQFGEVAPTSEGSVALQERARENRSTNDALKCIQEKYETFPISTKYILLLNFKIQGQENTQILEILHMISCISWICFFPFQPWPFIKMT